MLKRKGRAAALTGVLATALASLLVAAAPASAHIVGHGREHGRGHGNRVLDVRENAAGDVTLASGATLRSGLVSVSVNSASTNPQGHDIEVFRLLPGVTLDQVMNNMAIAFNPNTPGPTVGQTVQVWINQHVRFYGGYQSSTPGQLGYQAVLPAGDYYAMDIYEAGSPSAAATFRVVGHGADRLPRTDQALSMVDPGGMDQFAVTSRHHETALHNGGLRVSNQSSELHFAQFQPVKPGTTDAQVTAAFSGGPDPTIPGAAPGTGLLSPGTSINLMLHLPSGAYAVECFMPDKDTGMPHALPPMNMHTVVSVHNSY